MEFLHLESDTSRRASANDVRTLRSVTDWSLLGDRVHGVQFYEDDAVLVDLVSRFTGTALVTGDSAVVIATPKHREEIAKLLRKRGLDVTVAEAQGRYIPLDAARMLARSARDGRLDAVAFTDYMGKVFRGAARAAAGRQRVAAFGEMVALLWAQGKIDAAIRLEELWNRLSERHAFSLCCAYPMKGFVGSMHAAPFLKICAQHSHVFPAERRTRTTATAI